MTNFIIGWSDTNSRQYLYLLGERPMHWRILKGPGYPLRSILVRDKVVILGPDEMWGISGQRDLLRLKEHLASRGVKWYSDDTGRLHEERKVKPKDKLFSVAQVAEALGITDTSVYAHIKAGRIVVAPGAGPIKISETELNILLNEGLIPINTTKER